MYKKGVSGQFLYFSLTSVFSGNAVAGASGSVSGRRCVDGGAMSLLSGNIVEDAGGLYHANLYDWDTSGNNIGFLFTASGCAPVTFSVVTLGGISGSLYPASGSVYPASGSITSGVISSGVFVTATATIASGALSGQQVTLTSGQSYVASGVNAVVPIASISGAVANSGLFVTVPVASISGVFPASGSFSGQLVTLVSGQSYTASGIWPASGASVNAVATVLSGQVFLASGTALFYSGQYFLASGSVTSGVIASGIFVTTSAVIASGAMSGQQVTLVSGQSYIASGANSVVPVASLSGVVTNSGLFVSVPIVSISGVNANVTAGSISGVTANSGLFVSVPPTTLSGLVPASGGFTTSLPLSGRVYLASGVPTVGGLPWTKALDIAAAGVGGLSSGANTGTESYFSLDKTNVVLNIIIDSSGNRTCAVYS